MTSINMNLSSAQIDAIENILAWPTRYVSNLLDTPINNNTWSALVAHNIVTYDCSSGDITLTHYGIQSYCATILTKYTGTTHERIHSALNNYQRLFNS